MMHIISSWSLVHLMWNTLYITVKMNVRKISPKMTKGACVNNVSYCCFSHSVQSLPTTEHRFLINLGATSYLGTRKVTWNKVLTEDPHILGTTPNNAQDLCRGQLKCDGTRAETRFRLSAERTSPFKSAGASVQSTTGSRGVRLSGSNAGYTMLRGSVKGTGYPLHLPVSPSLPPPPCFTVCHHSSTGVYPCLFYSSSFV